MPTTNSALDEYAQKEKNHLVISKVLIKAANLILEDENQTIRQRANFMIKGLGGLLTTFSGLFLYQSNKSNKISIGKIISGLGVSLSVLGLFLYRKRLQTISKVEKQASTLIKDNLELFKKTASGDIELFNNEEKAASLILNKYDQFFIEERKGSIGSEYLPNFIPMHLCFFYNLPSVKYPSGTFANYEVLAPGNIDFKNNKVYPFGDFLLIEDSKGNLLNTFYENIIKELDLKNYDMNGDNKELSIIKFFFDKVRYYVHDNSMAANNSVIERELEFTNINDLLIQGKGTCRHMSAILGFWLQRAKEDFNLNGVAHFEAMYDKDLKSGHAWLYYTVKENNEKLILDPTNNVFGYFSQFNFKLKQCYETFLQGVHAGKLIYT